MSGVFLDTSFFVALSFVDDEFHERAKILLSQILRGDFGKPIQTSVSVLWETVAMIHSKCKGVDKDRRACAIASMLFSFVDRYKIELNFTDVNWLDEAKELYKQRNGNLDFVDTLNVSFLRINEVRYIASFDGDYDQFANENIARLC